MEKKQNRSVFAAVLSIFVRSDAENKARQANTEGGQLAAAIAIALYQYSKSTEKPTLKMNRTASTNSAWGSKIHGLRQIPNKRGRNERL